MMTFVSIIANIISVTSGLVYDRIDLVEGHSIRIFGKDVGSCRFENVLCFFPGPGFASDLEWYPSFIHHSRSEEVDCGGHADTEGLAHPLEVALQVFIHPDTECGGRHD